MAPRLLPPAGAGVLQWFMTWSVVVVLVVFSPSSCSSLKIVTSKQLEGLVSKYEFVVVLFQSTLTEHSKEMSQRVMDEVERVSSALIQESSRIRFAAVSLDNNIEAMTEFGLKDVPAIVVFREQYPRLYHGQRTGYTLFSFCQELLTVDPVKVIENKQEKKQFTSDEHNIRVVGYFPLDDSTTYNTYRLAAKHFQGEISFGVVHSPSLAKNFKLKSENEISIIKPGERPIIAPLSVMESRDELVKWINENKKPLWGMLTFQNIYSVWQGVKTTFVVFLKNLDEHYSKTVLSIFKTLAKQYGASHDVAFVIVDAGVYKEFVQGVGLSDDELPTFAIFNPLRRKEHFFPKKKQQLNINNAKRWLDSFLAGKLDAPTEIYSDDGDSNVVLVNEMNFEEIVLDDSKDVLVEFYAPWCTHCVALAPHYKLVAQRFQLFPSISLVAFDVQASKVPQSLNITGLPTLLFFRADDKKSPIVFAGYSRDARGILRFIMEHESTLDESSKDTFNQLFVNDELDNDNVESYIQSDIDYDTQTETTTTTTTTTTDGTRVVEGDEVTDEE